MSFWRTVLRSFRSAGRVWLSNGLSKIPLAVSLHVRLESRR
jgi:hypothetical protein